MKKYLIVLITLMCCVNVFGWVCVNDIRDAFPEPESKQIEGYVVSGASLFLQSQSQACLLLNEYEVSSNGFNFKAANEYAKNAIGLIEASKAEYIKAKELGLKCGVDPLKSITLKAFDYSSITHGMNSVVAEKIKKYFASSDVIGIYQENIDNIIQIHKTLETIQKGLEEGIKPDLSYFWKLYQQFSEAALFGNYATVFGHTVFGG